MTQGKKIFIGILSILPLILFIVMMLSMFGLFYQLFKDAAYSNRSDEAILADNFLSVGGLIIITILLSLFSLGVLIYFIVNAINNTAVSSDERIVWILLFIFVGMICFPIYWYMRIWKEPGSLQTR